MREGGIAGLEAKALVWKWNCGTSSRSIILVWKRNYETSKHYSFCGSGMSDLKVTQYSVCGSGTAELKDSVQWRQNLKYRICTWCAHEVHAVCKGLIVHCKLVHLWCTPYAQECYLKFCLHCVFLVQRLNCGTAELQDKEYSVCGSRTAELKVIAYSLCGSGSVELQVRIFWVVYFEKTIKIWGRFRGLCTVFNFKFTYVGEVSNLKT